MAYIKIFDPAVGVSFFELNKDRIVIGRKRALADCVINDSTLSREHAEIVKENDKYIIKDLNSTSGVVIKGTPVDMFRLTEGLNVQLGQIVIEFNEGTPEKKYKVKGTDLSPEEICKLYLYLPTSLEVFGRFVGVDAAEIFNTGDTIAFGRDGVKLKVPEMWLGEYNVLELKIKWPGGQVRSFLTEVIDFSHEEKCVYLKFHHISRLAYQAIMQKNKPQEWLILQVAAE